MAYTQTASANATTGTQGTSSSINSAGMKNISLIATAGSSYIDVGLEGSSDGSNWYTISTSGSIAANTTTGTFISNQAHNLVRANITHYVDGVYTVKIVMNR